MVQKAKEETSYETVIRDIEAELRPQSALGLDRWSKYPYTVSEAFGVGEFNYWQHFPFGSGPRPFDFVCKMAFTPSHGRSHVLVNFVQLSNVIVGPLLELRIILFLNIFC